MTKVQKLIAAVEKELKNSQGGYMQSGEELARAKKADLLTLPPGVEGTNCANCKFQKDGFCKHKEVQQAVTPRMCCAFWDAEGCVRAWKE